MAYQVVLSTRFKKTNGYAFRSILKFRHNIIRLLFVPLWRKPPKKLFLYLLCNSNKTM